MNQLHLAIERAPSGPWVCTVRFVLNAVLAQKAKKTTQQATTAFCISDMRGS